MKKFDFLLLLLILTTSTFAQTNLLPSIGIGELPTDETPVCEIPLYLDSFEDSGFQEGETVADFNLFGLNGNELLLSQVMEDGKPVLLIGGNYTCPVFRNKVPIINEIVSTYADDLNVFIIYGVEAHPINDISPYFGFENVTNINLQNDILYEQPKTYGERKAVAADMLNEVNIGAPVFLDGPCNEWWVNFGPAPNNAYLIDSDGSVFSKHGWFHKFPDDMVCDIDDLLENSGECGEDATGSFEFSMMSDTITYGEAGSTLYVYGNLENNSDTGVEIEISRLQENIPSDWASSMCVDVCYSSNVDYTTIFLEAGNSKPYTMYFYTSENPGEGNTRMGFRNVNNLQNKFIQQMYASTVATSTDEISALENSISIFPNPAEANVTFSISENLLANNRNLELQIFDVNGRKVKAEFIQALQTVLDLSGLKSGMYFYVLFVDGEAKKNNKLIVK